MNLLLTTTAGLLYVAGLTFSFNHTSPGNNTEKATIHTAEKKKIQVAILLDVSNSMDGLINQAKSQLWNMVSVMGRASCNGETPNIEIALYEYGRSSNNSKDGYVKKISGFTSDLDMLSKHLFGLTTNGGDEYCGHVINNSLDELEWSSNAADYKVIFIAGNESFLQGAISYTLACAKAKEKGVIVNTVYCGNKTQGIAEHWNLGGECGNGSFTNINANAVEDDINTPYDSLLYSLNTQLNFTYIAYGRNGKEGYANLQQADVSNFRFKKAAGIKRIAVKSKKQLYSNSSWDMVDAYERDSTALVKVETATLPDSLKTKSKEALMEVIRSKSNERNAIQQEIAKVNTQREAFINAEKDKKGSTPAEQTLETAIEKIIKEQAARFNMQIL